MKRASILAVDDEVVVCNMIALWLREDGYECDVASGSEQALELCRQKHYDLLISDVMMPEVSGIELLGQLRELYPDLAVILATAVDDRQTAINAMQLGAYGYVIKPFFMNEFLINVANALERRRLAMQSTRIMDHLEAEVRERTADVRKREEEIALRLISAAGYRDDETGEHIKRLGLYSVVMARALGWKQELIDFIKVAAPMHDVGKIGIPDNILRKTGKLTLAEFAIIRKHPDIGACILGGSKIPLLNMATDIALCHHEKWDGSGYPAGLSGLDIPEAARIVAIVDVYDALCHDRVYRKSYGEEKVVVMMDEKRGSHFDPEYYDCFREVLPEISEIRISFRDSHHKVC